MRLAKVGEGGRRAVTVGELMHTSVVAAAPDSPVAEAAAAMVREKVGSAFVMQGRFLAGILTERDVLRAAASGTDLTKVPVSAWMTPDPQSATPDTSVEDAGQIMFLNGFRHLPIVEGRNVCGVVSLRDLFAARIVRPAQPPGTRSGTA
jgi:CBS domain-containing protein